MDKIEKRKLDLKFETVRPLQADEVEAVSGGGVTAGVAGGASAGVAVSGFIGESITACPVLSAIAGGIATAVHTW
jgi:lactobin A/cerein 7B family class IIb bacteriocin